MTAAPAPLILPEFGLGAAGLGNLYTAISDADASHTLAAAQAAGLTYIDTAPFYGHGLSEQRVGAYRWAEAARPYLSTKVGRRLEPASERPVQTMALPIRRPTFRCLITPPTASAPPSRAAKRGWASNPSMPSYCMTLAR